MIRSFRFLILFALALLLVPAWSGAQTEPTPKGEQDDEAKTGLPDDQYLTLGDIFELEYAADPQISPDGSTIVFVRNSFDITRDRRVSELWQIEQGAVRPLLSGGQSGTSPRWSPNGDRIAYLSLDSGATQIHCLWPAESRSTPLTHLTETPTGITWSPDGQWIAFSMRVPAKQKPYAKLPAKPEGAEWAEPPEMITRLQYRSDGAGFLPLGYRQLFVVSAEGGTPRQLTSGEFNHGGELSWTADSAKVIFSANRHEDGDYQPANSEIYSVDIRDRKVTALTDRNGPDSSPAVSPNGDWIAYVGHDDELLGHQSNQLCLMRVDGSEKRVLVGDLDRDLQSPTWNASGDAVYFQYDDRGDTIVARATLDGRVEPVVNRVGGTTIGRPYSGGSFDVAAGGIVVFTQASLDRPAEIAVRSEDGTIERLTQINEDLLAFRQLGEVEEIRFPSQHDQLPLQGWIIKPPQFDPQQKYPLILEIHGGPFANYGSRFTGELQLMAAQGYVVLYMNPRGSTSYGEAFANEIHHNYPGNDYDDLMSGVDYVIEQGYVDPENLFVTGGSGGGVLTSWIIGKTDRFRAAVVAKPVINWYSFALTADGYNYFYKYWFPGFPWDHTEEYMRRSPISLVGNVTTPTMLLTGTEDYRTPMSETEQYYQALKLRKVEAALVRIPGASHGIATRPSQLAAKVAYILKWFDVHRTPAPDSVEGEPPKEGGEAPDRSPTRKGDDG